MLGFLERSPKKLRLPHRAREKGTGEIWARQPDGTCLAGEGHNSVPPSVWKPHPLPRHMSAPREVHSLYEVHDSLVM